MQDKIHQTIKRYRLIILCLMMGCLLFLCPINLTANSKYAIYFYNPETNINNFASLKIEFDTYLSNFGNYQFQPFSDKNTFEKFIVQKRDCVLLISAWHFKDLKDKYPMNPALVGILKGKTMQRNILLAKKDIKKLDLLKGGNVASAGSEDYTRNILIQMLGKEKKALVDSMKVLIVPKDIDALMAVGFGMAKSALSTDTSLANLSSINPKQYEMLNQLAVSKETLLPVVAIPKKCDKDIETLVAIIEKMKETPDGRKRLKMLGLDGWKKLGEAEMKELENIAQ